MMLALVGLNKEATSDIAQSALTLLNEIEEAIATETQQFVNSLTFAFSLSNHVL